MAVQNTRTWDKANRDAWQRQRTAQELASGRIKSTPALQAFVAGQPMPKKPFQAKSFDQINKSLGDKLNQEIKKIIGENMPKHGGKLATSRKQIEQALKNGQTIYANTPSECFVELSYTDGVASATFAHATQGTWTYEMSLDDFLAWAQADSLGEYFNAEIR